MIEGSWTLTSLNFGSGRDALSAPAEKAGLRVPEDMAVVGFDNIAGYINYPRSLCSVDCDYKEEAVLAVDFLRNRIQHPAMPPQKKTMPVSLVCQHSCRR